MKILIVLRSTVFTKRGGAEVQAEFIREACVKAGHEVHFAFNSDEAPDDRDDGTTYHTLPNYNRLQSWRNFSALGDLIAQIRPDIVYQRVRFSYTGIVAFWARKYGVKFVHGISSDIACRKNKIPLNRRFPFEFISEYLGRYGLRKADLLIAQTAAQSDELKKNFGLDCLIIPNGHPIPASTAKKAIPSVVMWAASIKSWKQPYRFIDLAHRLRDTNVKFLMAGKPSGSKYHEDFLQAVETGSPNLKYLGELKLDQVNAYLSEAALFVNTSEPREGFPNTFIQAWMRETPVVALHCDPDNVNTGNAIGVVSGTMDQLEQDVRALLNSPQRLSEMGKRAKHYADSTYDINVTSTAHLRAFSSLVDESR